MGSSNATKPWSLRQPQTFTVTGMHHEHGKEVRCRGTYTVPSLLAERYKQQKQSPAGGSGLGRMGVFWHAAPEGFPPGALS